MRDWLVGAGAAAIATAALVRRVEWNGPPYEDAAMLLRYSEHVARGLGIVWNPGEAPVDGATDFLFMLMTAALHAAGLTSAAAARGLGAAAHVATVVAVFWGIRRYSLAPWWFAGFAAVWLAAGPGSAYVAAGFGTTVFALFATLTVLSGWSLERNGDTWRGAALFAALALTTGLIRPDGAVFAVLAFAGVLISHGGRKTAFAFAAIFGCLGTAYFAWRWSYFGYPLPNPVYVKAARGGLMDGLRASWNRAVDLHLVPWLLFCAFPWDIRWRRWAGGLLPVAGYLAAWAFISDAMNFWSRFQYALAPVSLISGSVLAWPVLRPWLDRAWPETRGWRAPVIVFGLAAAAFMAVQRQRIPPRHEPRSDGIAAAAEVLSDYRAHGLAMAVSEAGLLPLVSGWRAIDTWGLNDQRIAHQGLDAAYLDANRPALIVYNGTYAPLAAVPESAWDRMTETLRTYAESRGYCILFAYGESPHIHVQHYYIDRAAAARHPDLVARLRALDYRANYLLPGVKSVDFARGRPDACPGP